MTTACLLLSFSSFAQQMGPEEGCLQLGINSPFVCTEEKAAAIIAQLKLNEARNASIPSTSPEYTQGVARMLL